MRPSAISTCWPTLRPPVTWITRNMAKASCLYFLACVDILPLLKAGYLKGYLGVSVSTWLLQAADLPSLRASTPSSWQLSSRRCPNSRGPPPPPAYPPPPRRPPSPGSLGHPPSARSGTAARRVEVAVELQAGPRRTETHGIQED